MFGPAQLSAPELRSIISNLPPGSAFERSVAKSLGRPTSEDWFRSALLRLIHSLIDVTLQIGTRGKVKAAPLQKMLAIADSSTTKRAEPEKPRTFRQWFHALGAFTDGVPPPPERR